MEWEYVEGYKYRMKMNVFCIGVLYVDYSGQYGSEPDGEWRWSAQKYNGDMLAGDAVDISNWINGDYGYLSSDQARAYAVAWALDIALSIIEEIVDCLPIDLDEMIVL